MRPISVRFVQFLREAVAIKTKRVLEVQKYPGIIWFSDLPRDLAQVRSPLTTPNWPEADPNWLKVMRVQERARPDAPEECRPWLEGVDLDSPGEPPQLNERTDQISEAGERTSVPPSEDIREIWRRFRDEQWSKWAEKAAIARAVKPIYQKLFTVHQQMRGIADTFDLFIGVGLFHSRTNPEQPFRRHLLAFPAELVLDDRTGTLSVGPAPEFVGVRVETDFLPTQDRANLQTKVDGLREEIAQLGADLTDQSTIGTLLTRLSTPLNAANQYIPSLKPIDAAPNAAVVSFGAALILRPRSTRSLEALLERIATDTDGDEPCFPLEALPIPWRKMLEDEKAWGPAASTDHGHGAATATPVYFPLPSNEEQSLIVSRANGSPGVVVQGPPGTGKSHTIANLISHYLALGQRVLVTAQTAQALEVLRDKMPAGLQPLCVSLLGDSRESDRELRRSVDGILNRRQRFELRESEARIAQLERQLTDQQTRLNDLERTLHQSRAAETEVLEPIQGYRGTRGSIGRRIRAEGSRFAWLSGAIPHDTPCPTHPEGWDALATYHASLDSEARARFALEFVELPFGADDAASAIQAIVAAKASFPPAQPTATFKALPTTATNAELVAAAEWIQPLSEMEATVTRSEAAWTTELRAVLLRNTADWQVTLTECRAALVHLTDQVLAATLPIEITGRTRAEARRDLGRLEGHYAAGGSRRRLGVLKPAIVKETEWVEREVTVDGLPVRTPEDVTRAKKALDGWARLEAAWLPWQQWSTVHAGISSPRAQVTTLRGRATMLQQMLNHAKASSTLHFGVRQWLADGFEGQAPTRLLAGEIQRRLAELRLAAARERRDELLASLQRALKHRSVASVFQMLADALLAESHDDLTAALAELNAEEERRRIHGLYADFLASTRAVAAQVADSIVATEGTFAFQQAFLDFEAAWNHRRAQDWLKTMLSSERIEAAHRAARDERQRAQETLTDLTGARAWSSALNRIDDRRRATLTAWAQAVARIPASGPNVFMRRAQAQRLLAGCLDVIPAWVVSLGRLYETVAPVPGLFDIAIVDEASQCWLDSLVLFYLAKQVIIVGDDKQISPTVVGVGGNEIDKLAAAFIPDLQFRSSFNLESSLFDHGKRYLADGVPLREHFRCVPEIIGFSNQHFYPENPLIPLRQVGKDRLAPLKRTYLPDGIRTGDINEVEARAIVDAVTACQTDPAYDGAEFGVICLQGDMQGERIEQLLLDRLGPDVFRTRQLRCGNPYTFQGDERDVMFLSMVSAPNADQRSLTGAMFEQRFNVAMSRARDQMWLFHSVQEDELGPNCLRRHVLTFFKTPPELRIQGASLELPHLQLAAARADRTSERPPRPFDSWFELDVALALAARGYTLSAQVEVAHKRIDLVIEGDEGLRLAVECDGEVWHGSEQYAQDIARQRQLERAEWRFVRVRESLFYCDEDRAVREVVDACEELGIYPGDGRARAAARETAIPTIAPTPAILETPAAAIPGVEEDEAIEDAFELEPQPAAVSPREVNLQLPLVSETTTPGYPDPRTAPQSAVRDAVLDVIRRHGPLTKAGIYTQYRDGCPRVERASKNLRQAVNRALGNLERMKRVESRDEGSSRSISEVVYRLPEQPWVSRRPSLGRDLDDVPLSELALEIVAQGALREGIDATAIENIHKEVARLYGVLRLRDQARMRLKHATELAFDRERLASFGM